MSTLRRSSASGTVLGALSVRRAVQRGRHPAAACLVSLGRAGSLGLPIALASLQFNALSPVGVEHRLCRLDRVLSTVLSLGRCAYQAGKRFEPGAGWPGDLAFLLDGRADRRLASFNAGRVVAAVSSVLRRGAPDRRQVDPRAGSVVHRVGRCTAAVSAAAKRAASSSTPSAGTWFMSWRSPAARVLVLAAGRGEGVKPLPTAGGPVSPYGQLVRGSGGIISGQATGRSQRVLRRVRRTHSPWQ